MSQKRRRYSAKEKMAALRKHFVEGVPVSDMCEELGIQPSLLYDWQRVLFSSAEASLQATTGGGADPSSVQGEGVEEQVAAEGRSLGRVCGLKKNSGAAGWAWLTVNTIVGRLVKAKPTSITARFPKGIGC